MSNPCVVAARRLVRASAGIDWDAAEVQASYEALHAAADEAPIAAAGEALAVLVERLDSWHVSEADGAPHVAITAGALVERGLPAGALAEVLASKLPDLLTAARRFADRCLADLPAPEQADGQASQRADDSGHDHECDHDHEGDHHHDHECDHDHEGDHHECDHHHGGPASEVDAICEVDDRPIPREVFLAHLADDRAGGAALAYLRQWVLPTVASLTRHRPTLERVVADRELRSVVEAICYSEAYWLDVLLDVELCAPWLVLCPLEQRGFRVTVDGLVSNFDLHALVADVLISNGVEGRGNPADVLAVIRGEAEQCERSHVQGSFNLYEHRAARYDLSKPSEVPDDLWVWNEGRPVDVPKWRGVKTLLVGPPPFARQWDLGRTFGTLPTSIALDHELPSDEARQVLSELRAETIGEDV